MSIHYEKRGSVAVFTLDNPPVNTWTPELHQQFYRHLRRFVADDEVHVGILTGAGKRSFCAGDDIKTPRPKRNLTEQVQRHLRGSHEDDTLEYPGWEREVMKLTRHKPIIGAINGVCVGQGMVYLLMLTDIRIAASHATFGFPEVAWGMGGAGGVTRLSRMIPQSAAMYMVLTGEKISAQRAHEYTLINEVVEPDQLMPRAMALAERIASHPPLAVRVEMEASYRCVDMSRDDAMSYTDHLYRLQRTAIQGLPDLEQHLGKKVAE